MSVQEQIKKYIASQPEPKRSDMRELHRLALQVSPECKLWFFDGKDSKNRTVSNPTIGYGFHTIKYADGKSREFFQIGVSGNKTGISVYILGLKDKKFLSQDVWKKTRQGERDRILHSVQSSKGYRYRYAGSGNTIWACRSESKREADEIIPLLNASCYRCEGAPVYDPYSPESRHKTSGGDSRIPGRGDEYPRPAGT